MSKLLPIPSTIEADLVEHAHDLHYIPIEQQIAVAGSSWGQAQKLSPPRPGDFTIVVVWVDVQNSFVFPALGELPVTGRSGTGAMDDLVRMARFTYQNLAYISQIIASMDTHYPLQIFYPKFWVTEGGQHPSHSIEIRSHQIKDNLTNLKAGEFAPNPAAAHLFGGNYAALRSHSKYYCEQLEKAGKYALFLWPPHCMLGSIGHSLAGVAHEAQLFHAYARNTQPVIEIKGANPLVENYSIYQPEVLHTFDGTQIASPNTRFLNTLVKADAVIIMGQAASHCVKWTISDLLHELRTQDPELVKKVYVVRDCMSPVVIPDAQGNILVDFTNDAEVAFQEFADAGMHVVDTSVSLTDWPGPISRVKRMF